MDERTDNAPHVVIELDARLTITGWNRQAQRAFGASADEAVGKPIAELLPVVGDPEAWAAALVADEAPRVRPVTRAGTPLMFEAWSQVDRDGDGRPTGATIYGHDVSARVATERQLALESTMLKAILTNIDITAWAIDRQGTYLYQDGKALARSGLKPQQFLGDNMFDQFPGDNPGIVAIRQALAGETPPSQEIEAFGTQWLNWFLPVSGDNGAAVVGVALDVSDTRRNEAELRAKLDLIEKQQEVIRELSTPIIEVWDGVITLPIVGLLDSVRTAEIMDNLLQTVTQTRARFAILDLTGVEVVDTGTASHLIGMIQAIRLLGAEGILTGIHPMIAQTIVSLGVDLSRVVVHAKLRDALQYCIAQLGRRHAPA